MPEAVKISLDRVASQRVLSWNTLEEIGCQTPGCDDAPTHLALVEVTLDTGQTFTTVQHYCSTCALLRTAKTLGEA